MADTQITGTLSADEAISSSLTANKGINASLTPDEEVSGALEVKRTRSIPTNLDDLGDVDLDDVQDGDVLQYDGEKWVNGEGSHGGGTWGTITGTLSDQTDLQNALDAKIDASEKGANNGVATLGNDGKVPSSQLPASDDDIFVAKYGVTTYAEIDAAYTAGKYILVTRDYGGTTFYSLTNKRIQSGQGLYSFHSLGQGTGTDYEVYVMESGTWGHNYEELAPISSPTFTGYPKAPTAAAGTNNTQIATTAFVHGETSSLQDQIGDLTDLQTQDKSDLVNAINEVAQGGGGGGDYYSPSDTAETDLQDVDYFPFYDTSASGKRKSLWSNIKAKLKAYFDGIYSTFSGSYNDLSDKPTIYKKGVYYGTCTGQAANQTKAVTIAAAQGFTLEAGATIYVKFDANNTYSATAAAPIKLNVNNTGAKNVYFGGSSAPTGTNTTAFGRANYINQYIYDGTYWVWTGSSADNNTTYSAMSVSELTTGTATTSRTVRADYLKSGINSLIDTKMATLATVATSGSYSDLIDEPTNQSAQQYSQTTSLCTRHEKYLWNYAYNSALKWFSGSALTGATSVLITIGVLSDYGLDGKIVAMLADNGTNKPVKWNTAEIIVGGEAVPDSIYITFPALAYDTTFNIGLL